MPQRAFTHQAGLHGLNLFSVFNLFILHDVEGKVVVANLLIPDAAHLLLLSCCMQHALLPAVRQPLTWASLTFNAANPLLLADMAALNANQSSQHYGDGLPATAPAQMVGIKNLSSYTHIACQTIHRILVT